MINRMGGLLLVTIVVPSLAGCADPNVDSTLSQSDSGSSVATPEGQAAPTSDAVTDAGSSSTSDAYQPTGSSADSTDALADSGDTGEETTDEAPTAAAYVEQIQAAFAERDVDKAVQIAEEARRAFPQQQDIGFILVQLLMQRAHVQADSQSALAALDRAETVLSELAAVGDQPQLGQAAVNLHYLKSGKQMALGKTEEAIQSLREAREHGLPVAVLYQDESFQPLLEDEGFASTVRGWMTEEAQGELAEAESFPFDFNLPKFDDETQNTSLDDYRGKIVIVDFWGTWCPPCRMGIPHFVQLQDKYADDLVIVGINYEHASGEEAIALIAKHVEELGINYPCLIGDEETQSLVDIEGFPTTLFIDRAGRVRLKAVGYHPYEKLESIVDLLLAEEQG